MQLYQIQRTNKKCDQPNIEQLNISSLWLDNLKHTTSLIPQINTFIYFFAK